MDNRVFNVNGIGKEFLLKTLGLVFTQARGFTAEAWKHDPKHGMILLWHKDERANSLPGRMTAEQIFPMVEAYLSSDEAKSVKCDGWDADKDHDGHNSLGWRVYCEDWGAVGGFTGAICAIRPAFMWFGK